MNVAKLGDTIIKTGICNYGIKQYRLFLCTSTFLPGTGDYEDDPPIYEDQNVVLYHILHDIRHEKNVILSNSVTDTTGGTVNVSGDLGQISGASTLRRIKIDDTNDLNGTLYFELTTKNKYGTENVYQLQMALTEITKNNGN